jgi:transposase
MVKREIEVNVTKNGISNCCGVVGYKIEVFIGENNFPEKRVFLCPECGDASQA